MTHKKDICTCASDCSGECPDNVNCPLDDNDSLLGKDRSVSRRRHRDSEKQKNNNQKTLDVVVAKAKRIADTATSEELVRAQQKCRNTAKKIHSKKNS